MNTSELTHNDESITLVLGGTGLTGRRVATRLAAAGRPVRSGSRSGDPAFDWYDESTWERALRGVGAVYLTHPVDLGLPGAAERVGALASTAAGRGARRLVLLSGRGQESHAMAEHAVQQAAEAADSEWTIVRSAWFAQNFGEGFLAGMVNDGLVALPAADAVEPFVDADDLADVIIAALTGNGHSGRIYEVTGPDALTFDEAVREITDATGRGVRYQPITGDEFAAAMAHAGTPTDLVDVLGHVFAELRDGRNADPAPGVMEALGRPPRPFAEYVRAAASVTSDVA